MRLLVLLVAIGLLCGLPGLAYAETAAGEETTRVPVAAEADGTAVELDVSWWLPGGPGPHPAVILTHGFGGSKGDVAEQARALAAEGYVVAGYTARGFGGSGGRIHLNDPGVEAADLRRLIDVVAGRPDVMLDGPDDPRLGVSGASYGGAVALLAAADDPRIDALAPVATWSDLGRALFPNHAAEEPGPMQQQWIAGFFAAALRPSAGDARAGEAEDLRCGRFEAELCRALLDSAETGRPAPGLLAELRRRSPIESADRITAPTLLVQGMADSLFGLDQADAMAAALARTGTEHAVHWTDGGHDAISSNPEADEAAVTAWFATHLKGAPATVPPFGYPGPLPFGGQAKRFTADHYPGLASPPLAIAIDAEPATILTPPGGQPASITRAPSFGEDNSGSVFQAYPLAAIPGQSAAFDTGDLQEFHSIAGAPVVRLRVTSTGDEVTLFVSLWQINGATAAQPRRGVAPLRVAVEPGRPTDLMVTLPGGTWSLEKGSAWRVLVTSTDAAYANATAARMDTIEVTALEFGEFAGRPLRSDQPLDRELIGVLIVLGVLLAAFAGWGLAHHRARVRLPERPELAETPVTVEGLTKAYPDGHRAVSDVSWRAEPGQVVGLLGPNGAGKTTTLRMVLGLVRPDAGGSWVRGVPVTPGAPVLRRVGALVEGPGFMPHLTGRQNLRAYWAATGRPEAEAGFGEALEVAALGGALDRPVKSYSQGMRQRLGIAQAMLGRPDLLILDEPTNGLDPPQIAAMRPILQAYAATGRTVVISSHLLWEVEQTCTHVVVMDAGQVLVSGPVAELLEGKRHLEELFLSVLDQGRGSGGDAEAETLTDRLRKVRPR